MSLLCLECECDLQPSVALPGREGGFVHPNVMSFIWVKRDDGVLDWVPTVVELQDNMALCFECVINKMPARRRGMIKKLFLAFEAEVAYRRQNISEEGQWIDLRNSKGARLLEEFNHKRRNIPQGECFFCCENTTVLNPENAEGFFSYYVIDKAFCESRLSLFSSYQWTYVKSGLTSFKLCFNCCRRSFPRIFTELSHRIRKTGKSVSAKGVELYLSPKFLKEMFGRKEGLH